MRTQTFFNAFRILIPGRARREVRRAASALAPKLLPKPSRYVLLADARTGSTLLSRLLSSHPSVRQRHEVFGGAALQHPEVKERIAADGSPAYLERQFGRAGFESTVGIKLLYRHFSACHSIIWGVDDISTALQSILSDKTIKIIHLKRSNVLKAVASLLMARATNQWALFDEVRRRSGPTIRMHPRTTELHFEWVERKQLEFDEMFSDHQVLEVYYEDLVTEPEQQCDRILAFLGVAQRQLTSPMLKQERDPMSKTVENYRELENYFSGTEWKRFFEE